MLNTYYINFSEYPRRFINILSLKLAHSPEGIQLTEIRKIN